MKNWMNIFIIKKLSEVINYKPITEDYYALVLSKLSFGSFAWDSAYGNRREQIKKVQIRLEIIIGIRIFPHFVAGYYKI